MSVAVSSVQCLVNPRLACAARVTVLGLCVCVSVTQHLTFYVFIRATNDTSQRRIKVENFKRFSLKMVRCEARAFPVCTAYGDTISRPFFYSTENAHAYKSGLRG